MIPYNKSFLGLNLIFRINGSPLYRAAIPGLISVAIYLFLEKMYVKEDYIEHPYGVGVLISSVSFLIIFRANYGYQRYWNACGDVHHFMSKWLDAVTHTGVFHMQQKHHNHIKPPSYFDHHDLNMYNLRRDRERERDSVRPTMDESESFRKVRTFAKSIENVVSPSFESDVNGNEDHVARVYKAAIYDPHHLVGEGRRDGGWGLMFNDGKGTYYDRNRPETWKSDRGFASTAGGRTPNLFLQELTHLASLLVAVAFSTLRSDIEGTEAPLDMYKAGEPWPEVDPDRLKRGSGKPCESIKETLLYLTGYDRSPAMRAAHNASRPLPVLGGVSDNEIAFLQKAKGPSAKVTLAWHWLSEFIMREHLAGSLGAIGPPIVSRLIQFLSDGMIYYNHARKTMFIPFPFPHAQISAFFVFTIMFAVPILMDEYANDMILGSILTFLTVTALAGLHEVARELENPFRNVPNDIPLNTLMAMFNESLITLFAGFHPDHYWDPDEYRGLGSPHTNTTASFSNTSTPKSTPTPKKKNNDRPQSVGVYRQEELIALVAKQEGELKRLRALIENGSVGGKKDTRPL